MTALAAIRPDDWALPLFLHVLAALTLIGTLALTAAFLAAAWRQGSGASLRQALRALTFGVLPAWIVLRGSAEWLAVEEGLDELDDPPAWIDLGYIAADAGFVLIVAASLLGWLAYRKVRAGAERPGVLVRVAAVVIGLLLVLNLVALYAMTTKPV